VHGHDAAAGSDGGRDRPSTGREGPDVQYEGNFLPSGSPTGTAEEALDCACGLYLNDPTAWTSDPRRFNEEQH
jgi:hypothetical protein